MAETGFVPASARSTSTRVVSAAVERLPGEPIWLELATTDPDRSIAFYGGLLGWTADASDALDGSATLRLRGAQVARLVPMPDDGWIVYLKVLDAAAGAAAIAANGGRVQVGPSTVGPSTVGDSMVGDWGVLVIATDPAEARVGLWQPGRHPGFELDEGPGAPVWFELHTLDFATAVDFYERVAGWQPVSMGDSDKFRMVVHGGPGTARAGIYDAARDDLDDESAWMPYFATLDADAAAAHIRELGGSLLDQPVDTPYGRVVHATDPLGTLFTIVQLPEKT
jgi:predicted enzyme related to lactoylglutathione lyase